MSAPANTDPVARFQAVSRLPARAVAWLWPGRIALGKLAILDGDPGLGKSLLALDLCARVSTGRPFPDGSPGPGPGSAIVLNGEDSAEDTLRPRLESLEADLERVFILDPDSAKGGSLALPAHLDVLSDAVSQTDARLVVIDPIMAFLERSVQTGNDASVRRALSPLAQLAARQGCAVLLVRHLNKSGGRRSLYRGGGSIGIVGACRCGWLVARDPCDPERRVLAQVKNNLAPPQPSLAFRVQELSAGAPVLSWLGPSLWSADQLLAEETRTLPRDSVVQRACDFLETVLADGARTSREMGTLAQQQGLSVRTLERAKRALGIRSVRVRADGKQLSYWLLPGQQLFPANLPPEAMPLPLEEWQGPRRKQRSAARPPDDL
jgi:hypothetical protein